MIHIEVENLFNIFCNSFYKNIIFHQLANCNISALNKFKKIQLQKKNRQKLEYYYQIKRLITFKWHNIYIISKKVWLFKTSPPIQTSIYISLSKQIVTSISSLYIRHLIQYSTYLYYPMKFQVNCEWGENKPRQMLYKQVGISPEGPIEERQFQVIERPNLRIYCTDCVLDITRAVFIITRSQYYCVKCFSNLEEYPSDYLVRKALKKSFTNSNWDMMDEVILTNAFKLWGFGNWGQIKEYLDYNGSPFPLKEIEEHFQKYYLHQCDYLPPFRELTETKPRYNFADMNQEKYSNSLMIKEGQLKRRDSKGEKKPISSIRSISLISSSQNIDVENMVKNQQGSDQILNHLDQQQCQRKDKQKQKRNECSILGYNIKRKQFELGQYDYTAENMLAELQFYDNDGQEEYKLKLQIIQAYNKRLEERLKRRSFVIQYKLLDSEYHFHQQYKLDKETIHFFQSFMRFTKNHEEYSSMVDAYSLEKRYEKFITNLSRIRERASKEGNLEDSYNFMKRKREKYIQRWEKTYNKIYHDKKRTILTSKTDEENGNKLVNQNNDQVVLSNQAIDFSEILVKALEHENEIIKVNDLKAKTVYVPKSNSLQTVSNQQI